MKSTTIGLLIFFFALSLESALGAPQAKDKDGSGDINASQSKDLSRLTDAIKNIMEANYTDCKDANEMHCFPIKYGFVPSLCGHNWIGLYYCRKSCQNCDSPKLESCYDMKFGFTCAQYAQRQLCDDPTIRKLCRVTCKACP